MELYNGHPEDTSGRKEKEIKVYDILDSLHIPYIRADHEAVMTMEACEEIARQIRLRALGGIILIDMIDMNSDEERDLVLKRLRETTGTDRIKTVVHGFTSLGLLELTRKRTGKNLYEVYGEPCHVCHGQGYLIKGEKQHERNSSHSFAGTDE